MPDKPTFDGKNGLSATLFDSKKNNAKIEAKLGNSKLMAVNNTQISE